MIPWSPRGTKNNKKDKQTGRPHAAGEDVFLFQVEQQQHQADQPLNRKKD